MYILKQRNEILGGILKQWQKGDINQCFDLVMKVKDTSVFGDLLTCTFS